MNQLNKILLQTHNATGRPLRKIAPLALVAMVVGVALFIAYGLAGTAHVQAESGAIPSLTLDSNEPGQLVINWQAPDPAPTDYRIIWAHTSLEFLSYKDSNEAQRGNVYPAGGVITLTLTNLTPGDTYKVQMRSRYYNGDGSGRQSSGPWTPITTQRVKNHPPAAPTSLTISEVAHDSLILSWDDPQDANITGYRIQRGTDADSLHTIEANTESASTNYTDSTVEPETTYHYAVIALSQDGNGARSITSVTTPAEPKETVQNDPPPAPTGLMAARVGHSVLALTWDDPQDANITGYRVLRGAEADNLSVINSDTGSNATEYEDDTVAPETTYHYAVMALSADGAGPQSSTISATTPAAPKSKDPPPQRVGARQATTTDVWTATLTPADIATIWKGCRNNCNNAAILSDDDFTYDSIDYTIVQLTVRNNPSPLLLGLTPQITAADADGLTLVVGSTSFPFANATFAVENSARTVTWSASGLSWTVGTDVAVKITVTNNAPTVANAIPNQTATTGTAFSYRFPANTFNDTDTGDTLTYTTTKADGAVLPTWLMFDAGTRTFSGTPTAAETFSVKVTASDGTASVSDEFDITVNATIPEVPANWSLKPSGLAAGDQFRLLFLSSTKRIGTSTDIATYNTFVQGLAAAGHADIQSYSTGFRVVGCTADTDARDNTSTTYTSTDKGVPIYWLNGAKVADQYEDFYDGDWDDEANDKNESGTDAHDTSAFQNFPLTGCDHDGTEAFTGGDSRSLGVRRIRVARLNSSVSGDGPISNTSSNSTHPSSNPMYGLSAVFQVAVAASTPATGTPAITAPNVFRVPAVLGVDLSGITDTNGTTGIATTATYKWQRFAADGTTLDTDSIGTGSAYTLTDADAGKTLKVVVSFTDDASNSEGPLTSAATRAITAAASCAAPTLTGGAVFLGPARKVGVGEFALGGHAYHGFNKAADAGSIDNPSFTTAASNHYEILGAATKDSRDWMVALNGAFPANVQRTLAVHFCDEDIAFNAATPRPRDEIYYYTSATPPQHWAPHAERTIYVSQDTAAPTFASATVSGTTLVITLSEDLGAAGSLVNSAFTVKKGVSGTAQTLSGTPSISGSTVTLTLATAVTTTDTAVKVAYTKPMSGSANKLRDEFGNETATFPDQDVTNNTATNTPATGVPTISGTAAVGQTLTASTTGISDTDGLPSAFAYQWKRVDSDGMSNPTNIGTNSATYTLTDSEVGKKVLVEVSFTDNATNSEGPLVSAAYPSTGTVRAADSTAPTVTSIERHDPTEPLTNSDTPTWRVTFSEAVKNVNPTDFTIAGTTATPTVTPVTSVTGAYDVTPSGGDIASLTGTITLAFASGQNIADTADNDLTATTPTGINEPTFEMDNTVPTFVSGTANGTLIVMTFSEELDPNSLPPASAFNISTDSNVMANSVSIEGAMVTLTVTPAIIVNQTVDVNNNAYAGTGTVPLKDTAGNEVQPAAIVGSYRVTNETPIGPPASLRAEAGDGRVRLVWTRPAGISQFIDYQFRHAPGTSVPVGTAWIGTTSDEGLTELVQELANGMTHAFEVRAIRDSDVGAAATVSATPMADTCMLDLDDRREVWSATMTVGRDIKTELAQTDAGYRRGIFGSLPQDGDSFMIGGASYTIKDIFTIVRTDGVRRQLFLELVNSRRFTPAVKEALRFHWCSDSSGLADPTPRGYLASNPYQADWSLYTTREIALRLPPNNDATGTPDITGTAVAAQALTASTTGISDPDGLPSAFAYQWKRVDSDGISNPTNIGADSATYTLTDNEVGKKVLVEVSFTDSLTGAESLASAAHPSTGTVRAADNTAPTVTSIERHDPTEPLTNSDTPTWRVTFSEAVKNVDATDFIITGTNATLTVTAVTSMTGVYDVTASGGDLATVNGAVTLAFAANQNIADTADNDLTATTPTGINEPTFEMDNTVPTFVSGTANGTLIVMTFSEELDPNSLPQASSFSISALSSLSVPEPVANSVSIEGTMVTLTVAPAFITDHIVQVYNNAHQGAGGVPLQDFAGNAVQPATTVGSYSVTNETPIGPPASLTAEAGDGRMRLVWTGPAGTSQPVLYEHRHAAGASVPVNTGWTTTNSTEFRTLLAQGLANGTTHAFEVRAVRGSEVGATATVSATPLADACNTPDLGDRREVWSATLTIGRSIDSTVGRTNAGYRRGSYGSLPQDGDSLMIGGASYTIKDIYTFVGGDGGRRRITLTTVDNSRFTPAVKEALRFHWCSDSSGFDDPTSIGYNASNPNNTDWSIYNTREIALSLAANTDTTAPTVTSITPQDPTSSPTNSDSLTWRVTFSEAVSNVDSADFVIIGTTATLTVTAVTSMTGVYDVTASGGNLESLDGTVTLAFAADQNIVDPSDNTLTATTPTGANDPTFELDNTVPTFVSGTANGTLIVLTFSEELDPNSLPPGEAFDVSALGDFSAPQPVVNSVAIEGTMVTLTVTPALFTDHTVTMSNNAYDDGMGRVPLKDFAGNAVQPAATVGSYSVTNETPIGPPASLTAEAGDGRVRLVWTGPAGTSQPVGYQYRYAAGTSVPEETDWTRTNSTEYLTLPLSGLANGTTHAFEVRAVRGSEVGAAATVSATPLAAVCSTPDLGDRREVWSTTMTVGRVTDNGQTDAGYRRGRYGSLGQNGDSFMIGRASYTIKDIFTIVRGDGVRRHLWLELVDDRRFTPAVAGALLFHWCSDSSGFDSPSAAGYLASNDNQADWSLYDTRELALSLPANNSATGTPMITGTAVAAQALTASTTGISDPDGLPSAFAYQWKRVDSDGISNPTNIGADSATYTLTDNEVGKKVLVEVSFTDSLTGAESLASAAHPSTGTVRAADNTAPTVTSIERQDPTEPLTNSDTPTWRVTFSEAVKNVDGTDFTIAGTTATPTVTPISEVTGGYDVTPTGGDIASLTDTITLAFASAQNIADTADNQLAATAPTGINDPTFELDNTVPTFVSGTANGTLIVMTFSEELDPNSLPQASSFTITAVSGLPVPEPFANSVSIEGAMVTLTVTPAFITDHAVQVYNNAYDDGMGRVPLKDFAGNAVQPAASVGSYSVTNETPIGPPASLTAQAGDGRVRLVWTGPEGTLQPVRYQYRYAPGASVPVDTVWTGTNSTEIFTVLLSELPNGTPHAFEVQAVHDSKVGAAATVSATPLTGVCSTPNLGDRREVWSATLTVGRSIVLGQHAEAGYVRDSYGSLPQDGDSFIIGGDSYTIHYIFTIVRPEGDRRNLWLKLVDDRRFTPAVEGALRFHWCSDSSGFDNSNDSRYRAPDNNNADWSIHNTREIALSLPANNSATGTPMIAGTAVAAQALTASTTGISDPDGLPSAFAYQWKRVDSDGISNPTNIGADSATYTLTDNEVGKKVLVEVSFTDSLTGAESLASAAHPSTGTVRAADNTAPTVTSIERHDPTSLLTNSDTPTWRVTFSEAVKNVDTTDFTIAGTTAAPTVTPVTNVTGVYDVTASGGDLATVNGTVTLAFAADQNIADTTDNELAATTPTGINDPTFELDNTVPTFESGTANGILIVLTFSENLDPNSLPPGEAFDVSALGDFSTPQPVVNSVAIEGTLVTLTVTPALFTDHTVTVSNNAYDDGMGRVPLKDFAGNAVEPASSVGSHSVTNETPIGPPASLRAEAGDGRVRLVWTGPAGVSELPSYQMRHAAGASVPVDTGWTGTNSTENLTALLSGLANGTPHTFEVRAVRSGKVGATATASATPLAAVCSTPDLGDRREVWSATLTVGGYTDSPIGQTSAGYRRGELGSLPQDGDSFMIGRASYTIRYLHTVVRFDGDRRRLSLELVDSRRFTPAVREALLFHWCSDSSGFDEPTSAGYQASNNHEADWSLYDTRELALSLPANNDATGKPDITGRALAGQTLTAGMGNIADADGLPNASHFAWQWIRAADETDTPIQGATSSTYTLTDDDAGKQVKVVMSFTDSLSGVESLISDAYPGTGTVSAAPMPLAVTQREDRPYTFTESDFSNLPGGVVQLTKVIITELPNNGWLARSKIVLLPNGNYQGQSDRIYSRHLPLTLSTDHRRLSLAFFPEDDGNGTPYASLKFKVNDSTTEHTMTINVTPVNDPAYGKVFINGPSQVGYDLTASTSSMGDRDGIPQDQLNYQWKRYSSDGNTFESDIGVNSRTYTLTTAEEGKKVKVEVSYVDGGGTSEATLSEAFPYITDQTIGESTFQSIMGSAGDTFYDFTAEHGQAFTTGTHPNGYTLSRVVLQSEDAEEDDLAVKICGVNTNGNPNTICTDLNVPGSFTRGLLSFTAPPNTTLDGGRTNYMVVISSPGGSDVRLDATRSGGFDSSALGSGWSIATKTRMNTTAGWQDVNGTRIRIAILGTINQ